MGADLQGTQPLLVLRLQNGVLVVNMPPTTFNALYLPVSDNIPSNVTDGIVPSKTQSFSNENSFPWHPLGKSMHNSR